ncbi:precorrin-6A reductase [uncultured Rummeliibacillus sp.]|uniref:precorrin-6A reductase n=1 Tax=uncultured Rummeliibacillus sp. TaxID=762292 RepID=UPI002601FD83|nr:precorrin-6A reductase [uncultured Rummeliibacillus sp.]
MIFMLAGTSDARELAIKIGEAGRKVIATVVTESAAKSLTEAGIQTNIGRLTAEQMAQFIQEYKLQAIVDASHPFAEEASKNALLAASQIGIPYIRYERASQSYTNPLVTLVQDYEEAAALAAKKRGVILLTTGSKTLGVFTKHLLGLENTRLIARMLPRLDNMEKCQTLGLEQKDIIAMQGPFSKELNMALIHQFEVTLMITKESGKVGSVDEKLEAALACGIETIMIARPKVQYENIHSSFEDVIKDLSSKLGN